MMHRYLCLLVAVAAMVGLNSPGVAADDRPNIVLLLCDDIGAHELGIYGHPQHKTPHLDRLARTGIYFETGYATPICHPTRFQIMTGQYGHHNGVYHFPGRPGGPAKAGQGADDIASHLTIGKIFQQAGYATAQCGKWQLSGEHPDLIYETGFDEYCMWAYKHNLPPGVEHDGLFEGGTKTARYWHPSIVTNGKKLPTTIDDYGPDIFSDFALDFARRQKDKPFLIYYPMALVHAPYWPTPTDAPADANKNKGGKNNWQSNVEYADKIVGKLIAGLEEIGQRDNTLFLFIGDNGTGGNGKGRTTEMGCRVPFIVNGPGLVKSTGACRELVDISDVLPTCCELAGIELPKEAVIDGVSFAGYLEGDLAPRRDWIYQYLGTGRVVRTKRWLLEDNTMDSFGRLYDCGDSRNGEGYKDVTDSTNPEVVAAKTLMREILADKPVPVAKGKARAKARKRQK
ncbi:MAG: sulfatase-like hydrolase/transferase [Pirellulaceae bacterium]